MSYLAASSYSSVRANPSSIVTLYAQVHDNFVRDAHLETASETIRKAAFCSVVANGMAPYGSDSYPNGYNLTTILASPYLECASYSSLTWRLFDLFGSPADVHQVGFNGGAIGNHAQLIVTDGAQSILLDPTIGLIAPGVTLAGLVAGQHYASTMNFFANDPNVQQLTPLVVNALANGLYHIRDGIYDAAGNADAAWNTGITVGTARSGLIGDDNFSWSGQSYGNDGNDTIAGGAGADRIEGGNGRDLLTGSAGNDVFAYHKASDSTFGS